jgi:Fe2+ transport system protein B
MKKDKINEKKQKNDAVDEYLKSLSEAELYNLREKISKISKKIKNTKKDSEKKKKVTNNKDKKSNVVQTVTGIAMLFGIIFGVVYVIYLK